MGSVADTGAHAWRQCRDELASRDRSLLSAADLDDLADACFWLDDPDESLAVRRDAYRGFAEGGDERGAALAAWRLFVDHHLVGDVGPATGWLERCRRHIERGAGHVAAGWLSIADAMRATSTGDSTAALQHAVAARQTGERSGDPDLTAMAIQAEGRARIDQGDRDRGLSRLDEAMVAVTNNELQPLFTGWVFCDVISCCYAIGDFRRATEWSEAAMRWCATLQEGLMYPGLCRVYTAELAFLRGDWDEAMSNARRACDELTNFDQRYAGAAFCLVGDLHRLRGEAEAAVSAYRRSHELGCVPQPGLALTELAAGDAVAAMSALRSACTAPPRAPLPHAQLLAAVVIAAIALGDDARLDFAVDGLTAIAASADSPLLDAIAIGARGQRSLHVGDADAAVTQMRSATSMLDDLGFRYEAAHHRARLAEALTNSGDPVDAELELRTAIAQLDRLGASDDVAIARRRLHALLRGPASPVACVLTGRELDVLRLVASGRTNDEIAVELLISRHTVARHMTNIRTKLNVGSRAAATALAYQHGWLQDAAD